MKYLVLILGLLVALPNLYAKSVTVDTARLRDCGGVIQLAESEKNLHLNLVNVRYCDTMVVRNHRGRIISQYTIKYSEYRDTKQSFTLSKEMRSQLGRGDLEIEVYGDYYHEDIVTLRLYEAPKPKPKKRKKHDPLTCGGHSEYNYTGYALTKSCNCGFYVNGQFDHTASGLEALMCLLL